ncbi:MAG: hypothetical protein MZV63_37700 [Marinilabiliales bacterium]|nr:hypothetical protein [Marinilabiliales bacterium]
MTQQNGLRSLTALSSIEKNSRLNIRGRQNSVRISYTGISTRNPEDVTYMFRMRGF